MKPALDSILAGDRADVQQLAAQNAPAVPAYVAAQVAAWEDHARNIEAAMGDLPVFIAAPCHRAAVLYRMRAENLRGFLASEGDRLEMKEETASNSQEISTHE